MTAAEHDVNVLGIDGAVAASFKAAWRATQPKRGPSCSAAAAATAGKTLIPEDDAHIRQMWDDLCPFSPTALVVGEIEQERAAQDEKWGEQNHPNGTGCQGDHARADWAKSLTDAHAAKGTLTWRDILDEEVQEAFAESDVCKLRTELIQVAAVACAWVEAIDRRVT